MLVTILQMIDTYLQCNTTGATRGAGSVYYSGTDEFTSSFSEVRVTRFVVFCVMFCRSFYVLCPLAIVLRRFTYSDYPFGILKLFLFYLYLFKKKLCCLYVWYVNYTECILESQRHN